MERIKKAYAENGDLKIIPDTPPLDGSENWEQGRGAYYELDNDPNTGDPLALDIDREQDNYFKNVISKNIKHWQENSYPIYFDDIKYPKNAIVKYTDGNSYVSKVDNNIAIPTDTDNWVNFEDFGSSGRIGLIDYGYVAKPYHIVAFGGEFNRADYPKLWAYLQANPSLVKSQTQWEAESTANGGICGYFSSGNNSTTFRVPNLDKAFLRPDNRGVAGFQGDAIRNITASFSALSSGTATGALTIISSSDGNYPGGYSFNRSFSFNASNVVPTSTENRPKNIAVLPLIVAK